MISKKRAKPEVLSFKNEVKLTGRAHLKRLQGKSISCKALGEDCTDALNKVLNPPDPMFQEPSVPAVNGSFTRTFYMNRAKEIGIKNFRVLNKAELEEAVGIAEAEYKRSESYVIMTNSRIKEIVTGAVARWKSGWTKKEMVNV